jgi:3-methyl-2-oxobutanoate hydroxymethyltransferase
MGGYRVQANSTAAAQAFMDAAKALSAAGCFSFVLEGVPDVVATAVTAAIDVPTIGIGAGPGCDGQVLVFHDLLGLSAGTPPKFVRRYADLASAGTAALEAFAADVRAGRFPDEAETYHGTAAVRESFGADPTSTAGGGAG